MKMSNRILNIIAIVPFIASIASGQIVTTWTGGAANDRFNTAGNWDEGAPGAGDTANIGGSANVEIWASTDMDVGATINMNDSSVLQRAGANPVAQMTFSDTLNFNDSSNFIASDLRINPGLTLNWNSTGTWTSAGSGTQPSISLIGGEVNMSAGTWTLAGNTATDTFNSRGDNVFNLTGGTIIMDKRMRVGQTTPASFNLGAGASLYIDDLFLNVAGSVLNFAPGATLHLVNAGIFNARLDGGFIALDGTVTTDSADFIFGTPVTEDFGFGDVSYTPITAIPEPRVYAVLFGIIALAFVAHTRRRRSQSSRLF